MSSGFATSISVKESMRRHDMARCGIRKLKLPKDAVQVTEIKEDGMYEFYVPYDEQGQVMAKRI